MHAAILLVTMPPRPREHTQMDLQHFSFLEVYSPLPGMQKETIPHPRASDRPHILFWATSVDYNNIKINKQGSQLCFTDLSSWV